MKITIDISQIVHRGTGVGNYTRNLVCGLSKIDESNQYLLFGQSLRMQKTLKDFYASLEKENFNSSFWPIPPTATDVLFNTLRFPIETFTGKSDIFHSSDWTQPKSAARKISTVHDLVVYKYPSTSHPKIISVQKRRMELVKKECDLVLADSKATKNDLIEILGFDEKKIRVVYCASGDNFVAWRKNSITRQKNEGMRIREKYKLNKPYFLAVGTREPRKNFEKLVSAFNNASLDDFDLVVVGKSGWGTGPNQSESKSNIKYLGFVHEDDLPGLYNSCQAFLYPSLYEGFGVPILEAMNSGAPVMTSNISSMPEVAGKEAIYVDPQDENDITEKIKYLARLSHGVRNQMIEAGYVWSDKFSWEKTARETLNAYEELV